MAAPSTPVAGSSQTPAILGTRHAVADSASDWIVAVGEGQDRASFASLFYYFAPRLKTSLSRMGLPAGVAEDLAQETLLMVWRKAGQFDPDRASAAAWIFTIARNLRIDNIRHELKAKHVLGDCQEAWPTPEQDLSATQTEQRLRAAMDQMPGDQADLLRLSYFEEMSHAEIAKYLDLPLGTVKSRLRRAAVQLRSALA